MKECLQSFFDGFGTELIIFALSLLVGGFAGYKIGIRKTIKQIQKGGKEAKQHQIGAIIINEENKNE